MTRKINYLIPALIIIIVLTYYKVVSFYFRYDTFVWLDKTIFDHFNWQYFFGYNKAAAFYLTPVGNLFFLLMYKAFGLSPVGYHLVLLLIHITAALLVYRLTFKIAQNNECAFLAALFFGIYPANIEAVVYIAAFHHSLCAVFIMVSFLMFVRFKELLQTRAYVLSLVFYTLSLVVKPTAIIVPLLFLGYECILSRGFSINRDIRKYIPFAIISFAYLLVSFAIGSFNQAYLPMQNQYYYIGRHILENIFGYFKYMVFPFDNAVKAVADIFSPQVSRVFGAAQGIFMGAVFSLAVYLSLRDKRIRFLFFWVIVSLLPILPFEFSPQSRYVYLSSIGLCALFALALRSEKFMRKWVSRAVTLVFILLYFLSCRVNLYQYENDYILWKNWAMDIGSIPKPFPEKGKLYLLDFPKLAVSRDDEISSLARVVLNSRDLEVEAVYPQAQGGYSLPETEVYSLKYENRRLIPFKRAPR